MLDFLNAQNLCGFWTPGSLPIVWTESQWPTRNDRVKRSTGTAQTFGAPTNTMHQNCMELNILALPPRLLRIPATAFLLSTLPSFKIWLSYHPHDVVKMSSPRFKMPSDLLLFAIFFLQASPGLFRPGQGPGVPAADGSVRCSVCPVEPTSS